MRKFFILALLAIIALGLFVTACNEDNDITDPEDAIWGVGISRIDNKTETHGVSVTWLGEEADFVMPSSLTIEIGGNPISLMQYGQAWMGETTLNPGQVYNVKLVINGNTMCDTDLRTVYEAVGDFPPTYDSTESAEVSWTLSNDNERQVATASSFSLKYNTDSYEQVLSPSDRSFTFPAEAVEDFGAGTSFTLGISQMNIKTVNDVMLISSQGITESYMGKSGSSSADPQTLIGDFLRLAKAVK